jgi:hypothetical protein
VEVSVRAGGAPAAVDEQPSARLTASRGLSAGSTVTAPPIALPTGLVPAAERPRAVSPAPRPALPTLRDAVFRRLLAIADLAAAAGGLAVTGFIVGHGFGASSFASIPLIVLIAKVTGRYDHDEVVLRKSTLDETPPLLALAGAFALTWSVVAFIAKDTVHLGGAGVAVLWGSTAALLVCARATARSLAQLSAPLERVLIVGSALVALAVKLDSPGPVFFAQLRVGRYGRPFRMDQVSQHDQ